MKEEPIKILQVLGLIDNIEKYQKNVAQEFWLKGIEKTENYFIEESKMNY